MNKTHYRNRPYGIKFIDSKGYMRISGPACHVREHVTIAEKAFGGKLPNGASIHHHDENKTNNANTNLVICESNAYHRILHTNMRILAAGGNPFIQKICSSCREVKDRSSFGRVARNGDGLSCYCKNCSRRRNAENKACL